MTPPRDTAGHAAAIPCAEDGMWAAGLKALAQGQKYGGNYREANCCSSRSRLFQKFSLLEEWTYEIVSSGPLREFKESDVRLGQKRGMQSIRSSLLAPVAHTQYILGQHLIM